MHQLDSDVKACIDICKTCAIVCANTAMNHCLEVGGKHVQPNHLRLMFACSEICGSAAVIMLTRVPQHVFVCNACAEICRACADSCEKIGDMQDCVDSCRACAQSCEAMSGDMRRAA